MMKKLKYGLLSLLAFLGLASFCSAGSFTYNGVVSEIPRVGSYSILVIPQSYYDKNFTVHCEFVPVNWYCVGGDAFNFELQFGQVYSTNLLSSNYVSILSSTGINCDNPNSIVIDYDFSTYTPPSSGPYSKFLGVSLLWFKSLYYTDSEVVNYSCTFNGDNILNQSSQGSSCDYSGYILESEIDTNYCVANGYCPTNECTGDLVESGNWSALFINDIQHLSAPLINITIPEEFDWDYTGNEEEFDLEVKGYNVDTEYIDGIIKNQTTLPNDIDFNNTISGVLPVFVPGLVIILLIYFIFRFIKKIF